MARVTVTFTETVEYEVELEVDGAAADLLDTGGLDGRREEYIALADDVERRALDLLDPTRVAVCERDVLITVHE